MNVIEIRQKIDSNNKIIKQIMNPSSFVLNNSISDLLEENRKLQKECPHQFEDGFCIYCDIEEEEVKE